jgi:hypothetical protein
MQVLIEQVMALQSDDEEDAGSCLSKPSVLREQLQLVLA